MKQISFAEKQRARNLAAGMFEQGLSNADIARSVGVARQTVSLWRRIWDEQGVDGLKIKPVGPVPRLSDEDWRDIEQALLEGPRAHGYATELWTLERIADLIEEIKGVRHNSAYVWRLLKRLGWSCQKPERRARERDEEEIQKWRVETWPLIKRGRKKREPQ